MELNKGNSTKDMCIEAVYSQHYKLVKILLEGGCSPNQTDNIGRTLLMVCFETAGRRKNGWERTGYKMVNLLLSHNADVNREDDRGWTCLIYAYYYGAPLHVMQDIINCDIVRTDIDENGNKFADIFRMNECTENVFQATGDYCDHLDLQPRRRCFSDISMLKRKRAPKAVRFDSEHILGDCNEFKCHTSSLEHIPFKSHTPTLSADKLYQRSMSSSCVNKLPDIRNNLQTNKSLENLQLSKKESYWTKVRSEFIVKKKDRKVVMKMPCGKLLYTCTETVTTVSPPDMLSLERLLGL